MAPVASTRRVLLAAQRGEAARGCGGAGRVPIGQLEWPTSCSLRLPRLASNLGHPAPARMEGYTLGRSMLLRRLYPARSTNDLRTICSQIQQVYGLPVFEFQRISAHLLSASSDAGEFGFTIKEFPDVVPASQVANRASPDYWDLAWRTAVGIEFNYQVEFRWDSSAMSRWRAHRLKRKLKRIFDYIRFHGEPKHTQPATGGNAG